MPPPYQFNIVEIEVYAETAAVVSTPREYVDMTIDGGVPVSDLSLDAQSANDLALDDNLVVGLSLDTQAFNDLALDSFAITDLKVGR